MILRVIFALSVVYASIGLAVLIYPSGLFLIYTSLLLFVGTLSLSMRIKLSRSNLLIIGILSVFLFLLGFTITRSVNGMLW